MHEHRTFESNNFLAILREEKGIDYFEIQKEFEEREVDITRLTRDAAHFTVYGHGIVADILFEWLVGSEAVRRYLEGDGEG